MVDVGEHFLFSYEDYRKIMKIIQKSGKMENFYTARGKSQYVIMRHDVEFSVDRAYRLAKLEFDEGFLSTFFFQFRNNAYNLLSKKNLDLVNKIHEMGHYIGLHYHACGADSLEQVKAEIIEQMKMMNQIFNFKIDIFSIHRPSKELLKANIKLDQLINAYQDDYFTFVEDMEQQVPKVRYLSDARHRWNYGLYPDEQTINEKNKVQILTHPYSWNEQSYNNLENFAALIQEKKKEYIETIDSECKHFKEIKDQLK